MNLSRVLAAVENGYSVLLEGSGGTGKCLDPETGVIMFDGTIKKAKDILRGDKLMGDDSKPRNVLSTCTGIDEMYKITTTKGDTFTVNGPHILSLKCSYANKLRMKNAKATAYKVHWNDYDVRRTKDFSMFSHKTMKNAKIAAEKFMNTLCEGKGEIINISLQDYIQKSNSWKDQYRAFKVGIEFTNPCDDLEVDPYFLGLWLGDRTTIRPQISSADAEIVEYITKYATSLNLDIHRNGKYGYSMSKKPTDKKNVLLNKLRSLNLIGNKHIPHKYLTNSRTNRLLFLGCLLDTDGYGDSKYI